MQEQGDGDKMDLEEKLNKLIESGFFDREEVNFQEYENLILFEQYGHKKI